MLKGKKKLFPLYFFRMIKQFLSFLTSLTNPGIYMFRHIVPPGGAHLSVDPRVTSVTTRRFKHDQ